MYKDKDWLYNRYVIEKCSINVIGEECGVSNGAISYRLRKYGIDTRTQSEAQRLYLETHCGRMKDKKQAKEAKRKISEARKEMKGTSRSEETKKKISESMKGENNPMHGRHLCGELASFYGRKHIEKTKKKISASMQGLSLDEWCGYVSYEPYCPKFNYKKKEEIRNQYNRICVVSGISALQNGCRLDIDHVDENKQQGCDGISFKLVPLTHKVHSKMNNRQNHLLLELLLYGNKGVELNYEF